MPMKLWMYENYIWELLGEEFIEKRLSIIDPIVAVEKRMLEKKQARVSFEPLTSVMPVQCSSNWTNKPTESKSTQKVIFLRSYIHIFSNAIALTLQLLHWHGNIQIRFLFTQNSGFGAISVTEQRCTVPISKVESHISNRCLWLHV